MTDDPLDQQLAAELDRRAASANLSRDWSRRVLLPAVTSRIDSVAQPVPTSRSSAFAGLAVMAVLILVLVVALPGSIPGPVVTDSPAAQSDAPASGDPAPPVPVVPQVVSAQEFATAVRATHFRSATVLVDGTIGANTEPGPPCLPPHRLCLMGRLERTDPSIDVHVDWIPAMEDGEGAVTISHPDVRWDWWQAPPTPSTGVQVLSVDAGGTVSFVGRLAESDEFLTPLQLIRDLVAESIDPFEVRLVDASLYGGSGGPCPPAIRGDVRLPGRICNPSWLAHSKSAEIGERIHVQSRAYDQFSGASPPPMNDVAGARGIYAIAPRLEGGQTCPNEEPCWQWDVVGRLSETLVVPEPTTPPGTMLTCGPTQPPDSHANRPSATWTGFALDDQTGLVDRCEAWEFQPADAARMTVTNPNGDVRVLELTWAEACASYANLSFNQLLSGFEIVATSTMPDNSTCDGVVYARGLRLYLRQPVTADTVSARVIFTPAVTPRPSPVATPQVAPEPMACSAEEVHATVYDQTGLVESCSTVEPTHDAGATNVSNVRSDLRQLHINWGNLTCDADAKFRLKTSPGGYTLEVEPGSYYRLDDGTEVCVLVPRRYAIRLVLRADIDARSVAIVQVPAESPPPTTELGRAWWELAPTERPTGASRELDVIVFERECANGESPEGRVVGPAVEYGELSVTITFEVTPLAGGGDCPAAPGAPVTVELSEPLGDRRLVDGGFASSDRVIEHEEGLLWVAPARSLERATARFAALLGPDACPETMAEPRAVDEAQLQQMANDLGTPNGMVGNGLAWAGDAESAVRGLGGFELYQDRDRAWYLIAVAEHQEWLADGIEPGDLVLADVTSISGGQTIWIAGRYHQSFGSSDCLWNSDATPALGPRADEQDRGFTVSISAPSASWTAGQSLDGFEAALEYSGARDLIDVVGSGSGIAFAYWTRLDGEPATPLLAVTADCKAYQFASGERRATPTYPETGFSHNGMLTLPAGIWRLTSFANFTIEECGGQEVGISASIIVRVR